MITFLKKRKKKERVKYGVVLKKVSRAIALGVNFLNIEVLAQVTFRIGLERYKDRRIKVKLMYPGPKILFLLIKKVSPTTEGLTTVLRSGTYGSSA